MEWYTILLIVLFAAVLGLYVYRRITGADLQKTIVLSKPVVVALSAAMDTVCKLIPNTTLQLIKSILDAAVEATEFAEKAWLMGDLPKEERNAYAKNLAKDTLESLGCNVTEQIEIIIAGAIEMACMVLPHGVKPETIE